MKISRASTQGGDTEAPSTSAPRTSRGAEPSARARQTLFGRDVLVPSAGGRFERRPAALVVENGSLAKVIVDPRPGDLTGAARELDGLVAPGYVDLQNNGAYGGDVAVAPKHAIETLVRREPEQGVTSVLPTIVSSRPDVYDAVFAAVDATRGAPGADVPGLHAEGPFINPERKGAHRAENLRPLNLVELRSLLARADGKLKILTLAPELPGASAAIALCLERGVVPSGGHTDATEEEMRRALDAGLPMMTHASNAMPKDLDSGPLAALTAHDRAAAGVIADGVHVKPELLRALYGRLGPERMFLVTDAAPPAGMPDGRYTLGDEPIDKKNGVVTLAGKETLAGSALTMDQAVRNAVDLLGVSVEDAVLMATRTPARSGGLTDRGELAPGKRADLVVLDPAALTPRETIVGGVTRFSAAPRRAIAPLSVVEVASADAAAEAIAREIAGVIRARHDQGGAVLGLATGSTPLGVYRELIRMHREEGLDFSRVKTFNLDEYQSLAPEHPESYHHYMHEKLFRHLDVEGRAIDLANVHVPPGLVDRGEAAAACAAYERAIADAGGIDVQLLGIGGTGHIGFNEPGSRVDSKTRLIELADKTREDAAGAFGGKDGVPRRAITMGVGTILGAKRVLLMATGEHKAAIMKRAVEGAVSAEVPATFLKLHPNATVYVDPAAGRELGASRVKRARSPERPARVLAQPST